MADASKPVALGDRVEIWCRFCRHNLDGVVSATQNGAVAKVQCRTCKHFQDYKAPVPETERREKLLRKVMKLAESRSGARAAGTAPRAKAGGAAPAEPLTAEAVARRMWEEATKDATPMKMKVYDPHRTYKAGDLLTHKALGLGAIHEIVDDGATLIVLFRDGFKRLEQGTPVEDE